MSTFPSFRFYTISRARPTLPLKMTRSDLLVAILATASSVSAFTSHHPSTGFSTCRSSLTTCIFTRASDMALNMVDDKKKSAPIVNGQELQTILLEWDQPLVVDAYATWCGPCLLMAPEFEEAAKELDGRVRFVKLDTDLEPDMATRLGIMGLPTLLYLKKNDDDDAVEEGKAPVATLVERVEGALTKQSILDLCDHHFFGGPKPTQLS